MKILIALLSALVIFSSLHAQQPGAPETKPEPLPENSAATEADKPILNEPSLIPETPPTIEKSSASPHDESQPAVPQSETAREKKAKTASGSDVKERIHFREVKTRALQDEKVQSEFDRARSARTDPEKREALKHYYESLYARMLKIDSSLKTQIATQQRNKIHTLEQPGVNASERSAPSQNLLEQNAEEQ